MSNCGIYRIRNTRNGKFYIGSTKDFNGRQYNHFYSLKHLIHGNERLQRSYNKEPNNFTFEILLVCAEDARIMYEQLFLDFFKPEYNMSGIAKCLQMTPEIKNKIRQSQLKNWRHNTERKERAAKITTSKMADYQIKQKYRIKMKESWSEERRKSAALKFSGSSNPCNRQEVRLKISRTKKKDTLRICRLSWYNSSVMYQKYWGA